jgi:hypothetical protein
VVSRPFRKNSRCKLALAFAEAYVFVKCKFVGLKGIFAAEALREKIAGEINHTSLQGIKTIWTGVAPHLHAKVMERALFIKVNLHKPS